MFQNEKVLAIVPARAGSKRFPGKHMFPLAGKPLILWTLEAAKASHYIDAIAVSTDSREVADLCTVHGVATPTLRPAELATDAASSMDVIRHEIASRPEYAWVILLQPTSPLRSSRHIDAAFQHLAHNAHARTLVSVRQLKPPASWLKAMDKEGMLRSIQDTIPDAVLYYPNGGIYIARRDALLGGFDFSAKVSLGFEMAEHDSVDVDTLDDMYLAQQTLRSRVQTDTLA